MKRSSHSSLSSSSSVSSDNSESDAVVPKLKRQRIEEEIIILECDQCHAKVGDSSELSNCYYCEDFVCSTCYIDPGMELCVSCLKSETTNCNDCGEVVFNDVLYVCDNCGRDYCQECFGKHDDLCRECHKALKKLDREQKAEDGLSDGDSESDSDSKDVEEEKIE
jgi:hypothetical protein